MNKMVSTVFKSIALSIIFVVIWQTCFYIFRVYTLNEKVNVIVRMMTEDVSEHNRLTDDADALYSALFAELQESSNSGDYFVTNISYNYHSDATSLTETSIGTVPLHRKLDTAGKYGDIMVIEVNVGVNTNILWNRPDVTVGEVNTLTYVYQVPCMRYVQNEE